MSAKLYLFSFAAGLLVGAIYGLLHVRSPAPPVIALVGLLGILIGEQAVPLAHRLLVQRQAVTVGWVRDRCGGHVFGQLPQSSVRDDFRT
jgi:XapX domain-containing protein